MMLVLLALMIVQVVSLMVLIRQHSERVKIRQQLELIASLTRDSRSHMGSIGATRKQGGTTPERDKARFLGGRTDLPTTGRQTVALKFEKRGGENERNPVDS